MDGLDRSRGSNEGGTADDIGPGIDAGETDVATGRTFQVSEVSKATTPLPELPYKEAVEALLQPTPSKWEREILARWKRQGSGGAGGLVEQVETAASAKVEACSRYHSRLLADVAYHPVMVAVHEAFVDHRPLRLSPDIIWLMIVQGVANHINAHAEELRPRFVRHEGQLRINIIRDDFYRGSLENPWPEVFDELSAAVSSHVGPAADLFRLNFSTTGPVERAALDIVWLDAMQSFFKILLQTLCGIPEITLEGTPEDWRSILDRVEMFAGLRLGLGWWLATLRPILGQFIGASCGVADGNFWRSIYRLRGESGGPYITGWIAAFFPSPKGRETGRATVQNHYLLTGREDPKLAEMMLSPREEHEREWSRPQPGGYGGYGPGSERRAEPRARRIPPAWNWGWTTEALPGGLSRAPFTWLYLRDVIPMEFLGGFVGVRQFPDTLALRPEIGWAVRPSTAT